jgi:type IV pilus assembly protein PilB
MICPKCKKKDKVDKEVLSASGLDSAAFLEKAWCTGGGCDYCSHTGYRGRTAVAEFLHLTPAIREMIVEKRPLDEIQKAGVNEGMISLRQAALEKALLGETTLKEVNRVTFVD